MGVTSAVVLNEKIEWAKRLLPGVICNVIHPVEDDDYAIHEPQHLSQPV